MKNDRIKTFKCGKNPEDWVLEEAVPASCYI